LTSLKDLNGRKVVTTDAYSLGEVDGIEFDVQKATITHLRVELTKEAASELRFKKPFMGSVIVCIPLNFIQAYGHVINLNIPLSQVKSLRECT
jgi:sporulation protein YlmC with PRC-barrel domain